MNEFNELLKLAGLDEILIEGVASYRPTAKVLSDDEYKYLISLDPTYQGGDEFGKFSKWILSLGILLKKDLLQYAKWKEQQDAGRNFPQPQKKSKENDFTDFEDLPDLLKKYLQIKNPENIVNFDSVAALSKYVNQNSENIIENDLARKRLSLIKKSVDKGGKVVYKDSKWIVVETPTLESNVVFGDDTRWCTTSPNGEMYHYYLKQNGGTYFVNLKLETGELYQLHFESQQMMDEDDYPVDINKLFADDENLMRFYADYLKKSENINSKTILLKYFKNYIPKEEWKDLIDQTAREINQTILYGQYNNGKYLVDVDYYQLPYPEYARDGYSYEQFIDILKGNGYEVFDCFYYDVVDLNVFRDINFDGYNELNLPMSLYDLIKAYYNDNLDLYFDEEYAKKINDCLESFGGSDIPIMNFYRACLQDGDVLEAEHAARNIVEDIFNVKEYKERSFIAEMTPEDITNSCFISLGDYVDYDEDDEVYDKDTFITKYVYYKTDDMQLPVLEEPKYGWQGFDNKEWDLYCDRFIKDMKKLIDEGLLDHLKSDSEEDIDFDEIANVD